MVGRLYIVKKVGVLALFLGGLRKVAILFVRIHNYVTGSTDFRLRGSMTKVAMQCPVYRFVSKFYIVINRVEGLT